MRTKRLDRDGTHRRALDRNRKKIYATETICGICGREVDLSLEYPHPMSKTIDHIIPVAKGGHPSDVDNLQLAHFSCNRQKSDKLFHVSKEKSDGKEIISNRLLPLHFDWLKIFKKKS